MMKSILALLGRMLTTPYHPQPEEVDFLSRAETQTAGGVKVTVAIPDPHESSRIFGVPIAGHGLQPVFVRVVNQSNFVFRPQFRSIDPRYFTPLEAAARCHYSMLKRLSAFGVIGWFFLPLLVLIPLKVLTAHWANLKMDELFQRVGLHRRPIAPGHTVEGFVYTSLDAGMKIVRVSLMAMAQGHRVPPGGVPEIADREAALVSNHSSASHDVNLTFSMAVPNLALDYEHQQLLQRTLSSDFEDVDTKTLLDRLMKIPAVTSNKSQRGSGDPVNLVIIGSFQTLMLSFIGRWDETEAITLSTCWKTARAFLLGSEYRYSPVSPLYLFGRSQDIALQQIRQSINVRMHLRLWLAPLRLHGEPVWVGQVSRDIGVRLTPKTWNLTTHRIDPDVDESRDYVLDDLLDAERVKAAGHVMAAPAVGSEACRRNLTGDPYFTDGKRVVILLSETPERPKFIDWS